MARRPSSTLSRLKIAQTALDLADEAGLEAVSFRAVAQRLGVAPMSLYHYVEDKQDLLGAVLEVAFAGVELPDPDAGTWMENLEASLTGARNVMRAHPAVFLLMYSQAFSSPALMALREAVMASILRSGLPSEEAAILYRTVGAYAAGFYFVEQFTPFGQADLPSDVADDYPATRALTLQLANSETEERFRIGLNRIVQAFSGQVRDR